MPLQPPNRLLQNNINAAVGERQRAFSRMRQGEDPIATMAGLALWFYEKVKNKGEWDYKQMGSAYQDFGNFNYGATGAALGFSKDFLQRMAGWAQRVAGTSSNDPSFGTPAWFILIGGTSPYGDDPNDAAQITAGFSYSNAWQNGCRMRK